ncbi:MAG: Asp-tRNA(Asn)/Glu-tRNA(Gln) amidotransferase subunit GatB [Gemmatimonadota bacterium]|nr:Asp-tRNA(Asn)/Glu-tRNA(Gln) amidotransferase subunit GatB [Gemmatimonadota bacterium]
MSEITDKYEMVVGLEVHVQLRTRSKAFCGCSADFGAPPNVNTCPVCLALPGALPVLNAEAVRLAIRAAIALECTINPTSVFARKNYFYPDLPKGYQISQFDRPLAVQGTLRATVPGRKDELVVAITRLHMEEDAGKSVHDRYAHMTAIDLNRAGVPLIEIVSEPDMRSSAEAGAYLRTLKQILEYADVSDVSMEEGSLRVDANVSARLRGATELGTKTEVKNVNSFSAVERSLDSEFLRQCALLEKGEAVRQETMLWDAAHGTVRPARSKEESHDYRYFPDPDLPPLVLDPDYIGRLRRTLPELPRQLRERFRSAFGLNDAELDAVTAEPRFADYFEGVARAHGDAKAAANWMMGEVSAALNETGTNIRSFAVHPPQVAELLDMIRDGKLSHTAAKSVFATMRATGKSAPVVAAELSVTQVGDDAQIEAWIAEALAEMPGEAARFRAGEKKLTGVLVGAVMKKSNGRADPRKVNALLAKYSG